MLHLLFDLQKKSAVQQKQEEAILVKIVYFRFFISLKKTKNDLTLPKSEGIL